MRLQTKLRSLFGAIGFVVAVLTAIIEPAAIMAAPLIAGMPHIMFEKHDDGGSGAGNEDPPTLPQIKTDDFTGDPQKDFTNLAGQLRDLYQKGLEKNSSEFKEQYERINERMDQLEFDVKRSKTNPSASGNSKADNPYVKEFKNYLVEFAKGNRENLKESKPTKGYHPLVDNAEQKSETKSDSIVRFDEAAAGALLLPADIAQTLIYDVVEMTPVFRLARQSRTSRPEWKRRLRTDKGGGRWLDEEEANQKTKPTYKTITMTPHKFAALYSATIEMLEDSGTDIQAEIMRAYEEDFYQSAGTAMLKGDGVSKPTGVIGNMLDFDSGGTSLTTNMLIHMQAELKEPYQDNATWVFNRKTRSYIRSLVLNESNALQYVWEPDFTRRAPTRLLGNPIEIAREEDIAGRVEGDFATGSVPILYADWNRAYEVVMRNDLYMIDDPYSESSSFVRNFHVMSRMDGKPLQKEAGVQLNITS